MLDLVHKVRRLERISVPGKLVLQYKPVDVVQEAIRATWCHTEEHRQL